MYKFDLYVCGSIYFRTVGLIIVEVRFICMPLDLFFAVLILNERVLLYLFASRGFKLHNVITCESKVQVVVSPGRH